MYFTLQRRVGRNKKTKKKKERERDAKESMANCDKTKSNVILPSKNMKTNIKYNKTVKTLLSNKRAKKMRKFRTCSDK